MIVEEKRRSTTALFAFVNGTVSKEIKVTETVMVNSVGKVSGASIILNSEFL